MKNNFTNFLRHFSCSGDCRYPSIGHQLNGNRSYNLFVLLFMLTLYKVEIATTSSSKILSILRYVQIQTFDNHCLFLSEDLKTLYLSPDLPKYKVSIYSRGSNSKHSNTESIRLPNGSKFGNRTMASLGRFIFKNKLLFIYKTV